jgi:hypothetical protein
MASTGQCIVHNVPKLNLELMIPWISHWAAVFEPTYCAAQDWSSRKCFIQIK